jgi:putative SOS response-associated peptidase YedK
MATLFGSPDRPNLAPRWNVAPTQSVPIIAIGKSGDRKIIQARWGLRPAWMEKDPPTGPLFNARGETVADKPAFRTAFARKRALVPANGFYEWKKDGKLRTPFFITRTDGAPFAFAALWEAAPTKDQSGPGGGDPGRPAVSTSIITTQAAAGFQDLHDRFPVILDPQHWAAWLDPDTPRSDLLALIKPPPPGQMSARQVSSLVNKVSNDDESVLADIGEAAQAF